MIIDPSVPPTPVQAQPTEEVTASGLIVPQGTIEKTRKVITKDDWKKWSRATEAMYALGILLLPSHPDCGENFDIVNQGSALECGCTVWHLEGKS